MTSESRPVWWRPIAFFLLGLMVLAAIISYFLSTELAIFLFAILVIFVSLRVSKRRLIDRLRADQVYYSLVAIVISAAYTVESAKRDQVVLQLAQRQSLDRVEIARRSLEKIAAIQQDPARFFEIFSQSLAAAHQQIVKRIDAECKDYKVEEVRTVPSLAAEGELKSFVEILELERSRGSQLWNPDIRCFYDLALAARPEWKQDIRGEKGINQYFLIRKFAAVVGGEVTSDVVFDGERYTYSQINEMLFDDDEQPDLARRKDRLEQQARESSKETATTPNKQSEPPSSFKINLGKFIYFYWPFALIALLGLKLARAR